MSACDEICPQRLADYVDHSVDLADRFARNGVTCEHGRHWSHAEVVGFIGAPGIYTRAELVAMCNARLEERDAARAERDTLAARVAAVEESESLAKSDLKELHGHLLYLADLAQANGEQRTPLAWSDFAASLRRSAQEIVDEYPLVAEPCLAANNPGREYADRRCNHCGSVTGMPGCPQCGKRPSERVS